MRLIMVLGYLGSGKTTFITNVLKSFATDKNAVLVNDFGKLDVDGVILDDKSSVVEKIYDGSIFCSCKSDKFVEAMVKIAKTKPDNIIVEASGLANPYTMLRELQLIESEANVKFDINTFCIVDATSFEKMLSICHAVTVQVALSDVVLINKTDLASKESVSRVNNLLAELTNAKIIMTTGSKLKSYFGYKVIKKPQVKLIEDITTQKLVLRVKNTTLDNLNKACKSISEVSHRIKGVVNICGKSYVYEYIDGTANLIETDKKDNFLVVLSCFKSNLNNSVKEIIKDYNFLEIE